MPGFSQAVKNKNITILGLGLLGRGVGDAEFLAACGAHVIVTDKKSESELQSSVDRLKKFPNVELHLDGHRIEDFTHADLVIKAAGVPLDSPEIAAARKNGVQVAMSTALFAKYAAETGATIVGITGTRGKSTITHMIFHTLQTAGKRAHLGGNVRGVSTLALLPEIKSGDIVVLELDSWQLQGFGDLQISPHVAVFSNLMQDHMNYYGNDMKKYVADKANIFRFQKKGDTLVVGSQARNEYAEYFDGINAEVDIRTPEFPGPWRVRILGSHNKENASLAAEALRALGLSDKEIQTGFDSFDAVEGRLQFVREINGTKMYNDNNATTPEATVAALHALGEGIALICGGSEKNLPLDALVAEIKKRCTKIALLTHDNYKGSARLGEMLKKEGIMFDKAHDLPAAVKIALASGAKIVLFSPAFASFGMFQNEYERNDEFVRLISEL